MQRPVAAMSTDRNTMRPTEPNSHRAHFEDSPPACPSPVDRSTMGSAAPGFYIIDQSEYYLPPMMLLPSGNVVDPNPLQRVPITPSMLFTYAHMRGPGQRKFDPLHHTLYLAPDRYHFHQRILLPQIASSDTLEGLPPGATYFWDPIACANLQSLQPLPATLLRGSYQPREEERPQLTYEEFIRQHPPAVGKNHYKGDKVWANFGYYLADGTWVDPESEGELYHAYVKPFGRRRGEHNLPDITIPRDGGPRIMSARELDMFYRDFAADVCDDIDGEGDPRAWRITPETFAQWASGASTGERYEEEVVKTPEKRRPSPRNYTEKCRFPPKPKPEMHFDEKTGSVLSAYEVETNPSLLSSPLGVDIVRPPPAFTYSYPSVMRDLERHGFGAAWGDRQQRGNDLQSTASTPESFTSARALQNLTRSGRGCEDYERTKQHIYNLRGEAQQIWQENLVELQMAQQSAERRSEICLQIQRMKQYIAEHQTPHNALMRIPADLDDAPRAATPPTPTPRRRKYRRYMDEAEESDTIHLKKARLLGARLKSEYEAILDDIEPAERERARLLKQLGISSVDEIEELMPEKSPVRDPLAGLAQHEVME